MMDWQQFCEYGARFHLAPERLEALRSFYAGLDPVFLDTAVAAVGENFPETETRQRFIPEEQHRFLLICIVSNYPRLERLYRENGYPDEMREAIAADLGLWVETLFPDFGYPGLLWRIFSWACACLNGGVKQFGRLQCNLFHLFSPRLSLYRTAKGKLEVREWNATGNPVSPLLSYCDKTINLHIPALGPLLRGDCVESLRRMTEFSRRFQPDYEFRAVVCYSWLLDPQFQRILKPESNIVEFQKLGHNYVLPGTDETDEVIWRLWGEEGKKRGVAAVEHRTSMQRRVAEFLLSGGRFQEGGLVIFRDELPELFKGL